MLWQIKWITVQGKPGKAAGPAGLRVVRAAGPAGQVDGPLLGCMENSGGGGKKGPAGQGSQFRA
jgi:hypothetical protein